MIANLAFTTPLLLVALAALPVLWWLLRAVPPAPVKRRFPGIALLLGLTDDDTQTDTTPWWLLMLRMLAVAAFIVGFAGPVLNPEKDRAGSGPLLIAMDGSWASARDWPARIARVEDLLAEAARQARPAAIAILSDPQSGALSFQSADAVAATLKGIQPRAWQPDAAGLQAWITRLGDADFETVWFSDGLEHDSRAGLLAAFEARGAVTVVETARPVFALKPAVFQDGRISITALRSPAASAQEVTLLAVGPDPNGAEQTLATGTAAFAIGAMQAEVLLDLPSQLRNRVNRFEVQGTRSAGAVTLTDDALKRREVGLLSGRDDQEAQDLLSPLYYLNKALVPTADLIEGTLQDMLLASPDVLMLADVATVSDAERDALLDWVDEGGMLVRFAGPRTAAADIERRDPLMPVRLRAGGRSVGGAMSWGEPKALRAFTRDSPFFGLDVPDDVQVRSQVVAQPDPDLAARTIASLADGTPLVTRKSIGDGQVILFHVTANAEWSTLPLSGLFVQMLERLAISTRPAEIAPDDLIGTTWVAEETLDAFGVVRDAGNLAGVAGEKLAGAAINAELPPGLYAGGDRRIALNVMSADATVAPAVWPAGTPVEGLTIAQETPLMGTLLSLALGLLLVDILASLALSGKLRGGVTAAVVVMAAAVAALPEHAAAQEDSRALEATSEVVLAYVKTGDAKLDQVSDEGLRGLSLSLFRRTSVEPADPIAVDLEEDELSFFPILYWPIIESQPTPSPQAYAKLNRYLRTGGMILFDTRDGNIGGFGASTPLGRKLQALAAPLDIPALEPIPQDHVLTRTFYLLQDFPGRFTSRDIWVEAAPATAEAVEGLPFRDLNDGVTPVLIGGNDWAAAWARDERGNPRYPVGRGFAGERQRELAIRFGVNVVMHVLTGNYKSDQVHVPALLERLGN
ncbi:DUF4159 domain-containing protein [uncultured Litoreibacter sp.]|uniref:DUF4159 domain-containing protein n=1 Tax=uncultured Litoreibacter sp. TaxID=1392394 RepID=UPI002621C34E|nr:DUF4159 domain-containing protein [uncultured Litoreibacter sp.]